jgi:hypothetical protein
MPQREHGHPASQNAGLHRLASLDDLYSLATEAEITVSPEIKTAC